MHVYDFVQQHRLAEDAGVADKLPSVALGPCNTPNGHTSAGLLPRNHFSSHLRDSEHQPTYVASLPDGLCRSECKACPEPTVMHGRVPGGGGNNLLQASSRQLALD